MEFRMPSVVKRVVSLEVDKMGRTVPRVTYKKKKSKKKRDGRGVRQTEQMFRRVAEAQQAFVNTYLERVEKSNERPAANNAFLSTPKSLRTTTV